MKVKELIAELKKCPENLEVTYVSETDFTEGEITYVEYKKWEEFDDEVYLG